jgi:hypothetical protein
MIGGCDDARWRPSHPDASHKTATTPTLSHPIRWAEVPRRHAGIYGELANLMKMTTSSASPDFELSIACPADPTWRGR